MMSTRSTFFRQSGWMIVATTASGAFMYAVHVAAASKMDTAEYAVFAALLKVFLLMSFPAIGLQVIFTQQAAAAVSESEQRQVGRGCTIRFARDISPLGHHGRRGIHLASIDSFCL